MLTALLKKWGYEVVSVEDGKKALDALQDQESPRLAILDWNMPGLDGTEVCARIRSRETSDPPYLILLTAREEKESIVRGLEAGANDYLTKPFNHDELHARIRVGQRVLDLQESLNKARDALAYEAMHDPLTGVLNRRAILEILEKETSRANRTGVPFSVAIVDIDHFKKINDTLGHQCGDDVLVALTRVMSECCRAYDSVGRYGGEEFLVVSPGCSDENAKTCCERVRNAIASTPLPTRSGEVNVTVSIGVAVYKAGAKSEALLGAADAALYQAKKEGRNCVVVAETGQTI